jgi:hypothetical protein
VPKATRKAVEKIAESKKLSAASWLAQLVNKATQGTA